MYACVLDLKFLKTILALFWKTTHYEKCFKNSVSKVCMAIPIDVVVLKCRKICPTENR